MLNVTPDSFSDGGQWLGKTDAIRHALEMQAEGADIIAVSYTHLRAHETAYTISFAGLWV